MILQNSARSYIFQAMVLGQPLFWMWLFDTDFVFIRERFSQSFYIVSVLVFKLVYDSGFSIGFYTNSLILQYISYTLIAVYMFNTRYNIKQALSLGFLTVFLNSYYWEIPLHLAEVLSGTIHIGMIVQLWRLVPLFFFFKHYRFSVYDRAVLSVGLGFSTIIMGLRTVYRISGLVLYPINRVFCLCLLIKVLMEATPKIDIKENESVKVIV